MPLRRENTKSSTWRLLAALTVSVGILVPSMAMAAGFATPGVGTRARAMGGAFRGIADDWSAASYNPAGLAFLKASELNFTFGAYSPDLEYVPNVSGNGVDIGFNAANSTTRYPLDISWPVLSMAGMVVNPDWEGFVFGGAIYWPQDVNYAWNLFRAPDGYNSDYEFAKKNYQTDLDVLDIQPTVARKFGENLSLGLGLSFTSADIVFRRVMFFENQLGSPFNVYPYHQFAGDFRLEGNGFALGANFGLLWKASENISIGISGQTPVTVTIEGLSYLDMAWPVNPTFEGETVVVDGDSVKTSLYFTGIHDPLVNQQNPSHSSSSYAFDMDLPAQLGVGIGWTASERLTVGLDAVMTFWSAVDRWDIVFAGNGLNIGTSRLMETTVPFGWDDQLRIASGFEYLWSENLALRGGAYFEGGAAPDSTFSPNFPNDGDAVGISGGFAYRLNDNIEFSGAGEMATISKRDVASVDNGVGQTVFPGTYSLNRYEFIFGVGYRF